MNIPHRIFYYNKNYNKELSGYEQEDFDLSKLRTQLGFKNYDINNPE